MRSLISRNLQTVGMDDPLWLVQDMMLTHGIHHVVVEDEGRVVGVVSRQDVLGAVSPARNSRGAREADLNTLNKRAHQIMSYRPICVHPDAAITDAVRLMLEHRVHALPVVSTRGRCLGVVTATDILGWSLALAQVQRATLPLRPPLQDPLLSA